MEDRGAKRNIRRAQTILYENWKSNLYSSWRRKYHTVWVYHKYGIREFFFYGNKIGHHVIFSIFLEAKVNTRKKDLVSIVLDLPLGVFVGWLTYTQTKELKSRTTKNKGMGSLFHQSYPSYHFLLFSTNSSYTCNESLSEKKN
jgi:hypothetical protein